MDICVETFEFKICFTIFKYDHPHTHTKEKETYKNEK